MRILYFRNISPLNIIKKTLTFFKSMNFFWKLFLIYLFIVVLPITYANYFLVNIFSKNIMEDSANTYSNNNMLLSKNIQYHFNEMDNLVNSMLYNRNIYKLIAQNELYAKMNQQEPYKSWKNTEEIEYYLLSLMMVQPFCLDISIYTQNGFIYHNSKYSRQLNENTKQNYQNLDWFKEAKKRDGKKLFLGTHVQMHLEKGDKVFSLLKMLKTEGMDYIGVVMIDMDYNLFKRMFDTIKFNPGDNMIIADEKGIIVYERYEADIGKPVDPQLMESIYVQNKKYLTADMDSKKYFVTSSTDKTTGWRFISVHSYDNVSKKIDSIRRLTISLMLFSLVMILITYLILTLTFFRPIRDLSNKMIAASKGNFSIRFTQKRSDEVGRIGISFNILIGSIIDLLDKQRQAQIRIRDSEIKALQAQINPHFMYNTLNAIKWMAIEVKAEKIRKMITSLVSLMKNSINKGGALISIEDEIENIKNFVYILNMRYYEKYSLIIETNGNVNKSRILKMLLQPIVENAMLHGFKENQLNERIIRMVCCVSDEKLFIYIIDNGLGMDEDTLNRILSDNEKSDNHFNGIGVYNVLERIKLSYGDPYGIDIKSTPGTGTAVKFTLPFIALEEV